MHSSRSFLKFASVCLVAFGALVSCESDGSGEHTQPGAGYYSVSSYDPWYYGTYDDPDDIATIPPGSKPEAPPRPAHPIALPPPPRPQPMPGIPMRSRPALRR